MKIERIEKITEEFENLVYGGFGEYAKKNNVEVNFKNFAFTI